MGFCRSLVWVLFCILGVFASGVFLSPIAYWICQWMAGHGWFEELARFPFHRYFTRTVQITAAVFLLITLARLKMWRLVDFGLKKNPLWWKDWLAGFAFAFLPLSVFFLIGLWNGWFALRSEIQLEGLGRIALSAIFVGFFEEVLFRGIAFGILIRLLGSFWAGVLVSAFFASVHFLRPGNRVTNEVNWLSGWHQMLAVFDSVPEMPLLAWGWGTLFFIGLILAFAVNRTRSLWHAFGLHAGWIFGQQGINFIAKWSFLGDLSNGVLLLGPTLVSGMVPTGVIPLLVISGCGILSWAWLRRR